MFDINLNDIEYNIFSLIQNKKLMNEILDFLMQHWQLSSLFVVLVVAYAIFEVKQDPGSKQVSAEQAVALYNHEQALILDIRSADAYEAGHIVGAVHLAADHIESKLKKLQKYSQKPVIVVCNAGRQATKIVKRLEAEGFSQPLSLAGGMNAWQTANLPVTKVPGKIEI